MKPIVKCEMCDVEVPVDECVFATHKIVIEGKECACCCAIMQRKQQRRGVKRQ